MRILAYSIRVLQSLLLVGAILCLAIGIYQLSTSLWYFTGSASVSGTVTGYRIETEYRERHPGSKVTGTFEQRHHLINVYYPEFQYRWPEQGGDVYRSHSRIGFETIPQAYERGARTQLRIDPERPQTAELDEPLSYLFVPVALALIGIVGTWLLGRLFFAYELVLGIHDGKGLSLLRGARPVTALVVPLLMIVGLVVALRLVFPWLGTREMLALATGEVRQLPALLAARGTPSSETNLNEAERQVASLPVLGGAYASTAVELAITSGDFDTLDRYLQAYENPRVEFPVASQRAVSAAAIRPDPAALERLLRAGLDPNVQPYKGAHPVRQAIKANQVASLMALSRAGADFELASADGGPLGILALDYAAANALDWLLQNDIVAVNTTDPQTRESLMDTAIHRGDNASVRVLAKRHAPTSVPGAVRSIALGDWTGFTRMLDRSRWSGYRYRDGSLLHWAVRHGQADIAKYLVEAGVDPNVRVYVTTGNDAPTPLHLAVARGDTGLVELLLAAPGIDVNLGDRWHRPPLYYAADNGHWDMIPPLVEAGATINAPLHDPNNNTILHLAAKGGDVRTVTWLLDRGADPKQRNNEQLTAFDVAQGGDVYERSRRDLDKVR